MAAAKKATETAKSGIEIRKENGSTDLILSEDMASEIWNNWKPGTVNVCIGSADNIVGTGTFNKIGSRAAFYFQKAERGKA